MKIKLAHPLISCICITNNRPEMLLKTVFTFVCQNYPNKELIISYPADDLATKEVISQISDYTTLEIKCIERDKNESLGMARNHAIACANGAYVCMWDDDDLYHYNRIMHQFNNMQGKYIEAGVLTNVFIYDSITRKGYYSYPNNWTGTLICRKDLILTYPFADCNTVEDIHLIGELESRKLLYKISDSPYLYTFVHHNNNASDDFHFQYHLRKSMPLDEENTNYLRSQFETKLELR